MEWTGQMEQKFAGLHARVRSGIVRLAATAAAGECAIRHRRRRNNPEPLRPTNRCMLAILESAGNQPPKGHAACLQSLRYKGQKGEARLELHLFSF